MSLFVIIEGIDGAGGETQSKLLIEFLQKNGWQTQFINYPDYDGPIGLLIHDFLHKKYDFPPDVQFSLYATDMVKDREKILNVLKEDKVVIGDRYFHSTLAYESLTKGFGLERGLKFAEVFDMPVPDLVIFLEVSPETSMKRKFGEKKNLDRHEEDKKLLEKVKESYHDLIKNKVFAKELVIIDGEKSIEEVAKEVQEIVISKLKK